MKPSEREFVAESAEVLEQAGAMLLEIQDTIKTGVNPDTINALFRSMHTLKGTSGLFGFGEVTEISHALENLLDDIRLGRVEITDELIDFLFKYLDVLKSMIQGLADKKRPDVSGHLAEIEAYGKSLKTEVSGGLEAAIDPSILGVLSEYEEHRLKANLKSGNGVYIVKAAFKLADFDVALEALTKKIKNLGELISTMPTSSGDIPQDSIGFDLMTGSPLATEEIGNKLALPIKTIAEPKKSRGRVETQEKIKTSSTTVRVDIEKLDRILNTIGELTLARDALRRIWSEMVELYGHGPLVVDLYRVTQAFQRRLVELQDQVLSVRMVPVGQIFGRLSQVVRRYSREVDKQINLSVFGEDTEIDKFLAEEIIDPLVHIIRNSIDHGIETSDERAAAGKGKAGGIVLRAYQRGNHVLIEVSDDGAGINVEKIKQKALKVGLIDPGSEPSEEELLNLIFKPGFSTKESVSEVSGRGVGMDIVREKLSSMGGVVEVISEKGLGTIVTLTLPITLAMLKALIVRVGAERFAVPLTSISETLVLEHSSLKSVENRKIFNLRGEMLPMKGLGEILNIPYDSVDRSFAVVVNLGERTIGLLVDELVGQHEVVIKPLGDYFEGVKGFAGAAEIGKHEVVLVLDIESILEEVTRKGALHV